MSQLEETGEDRGIAGTSEEGLTGVHGVALGAESTGRVELGAVPPELAAHRHAFGQLLGRGSHDDHHEHEVPDSVRRYLVTGEEHATVFPLHPCAMGTTDLVLVGALAAAVALNVLAAAHGLAHPWLVRSIWVAFTVAAGWWAWQLAAFRSTWIVVTPKRIMTVARFPVTKVTSLPWRRARDVELAQTILGRVFGYGTLQLLSIGTDHALAKVQYVPRAEHVYRVVWAILQPARGPSPMPEDAW